LAWLVDWGSVLVLASAWYAWALPWLGLRKDELPWPLSEVLPWALGLAPAAFVLIILLIRDMGRWRRSPGMALMRLAVEGGEGGVPSRARMLGRRGASLLSWFTFGMGYVPAFLGRRALQDCLSGTRVVRRGPARPWLALVIIAAGLLSVWGAVCWATREPTHKGWRWGYLDRAGRVVIEPRYQTVKPFRDGLALVRKDGAWHWLDRDGHLMTRLGAFDTCLLSVGGVAVFQDGRIRTTCLDLKGQLVAEGMGEVFPPLEPDQPFAFMDLMDRGSFRRADGAGMTGPIMEEVWPYQDGLGRFKQGGKMGALDVEGHLAIPPTFDELEPFSDGLAAARLNQQWGLLDRKGRWVLEPRFQELRGMDKDGSGLLAAKMENQWGYVHRDGTWAIPPRFDQVKAFTKGGWARVKVGERWGVVDAGGAWVLEPRFEEVGPPEEAPFAFRQGLRWGYVVPGGRVVVAPIFSHAGRFHEKSAFAKGLNRWFRVEASGRVEPLPLGWIMAMNRALDADRIPFAQGGEVPR
jgi:hypothetical protein